jgi:hypothetical protein
MSAPAGPCFSVLGFLVPGVHHCGCPLSPWPVCLAAAALGWPHLWLASFGHLPALGALGGEEEYCVCWPASAPCHLKDSCPPAGAKYILPAAAHRTALRPCNWCRLKQLHEEMEAGSGRMTPVAVPVGQAVTPPAAGAAPPGHLQAPAAQGFAAQQEEGARAASLRPFACPALVVLHFSTAYWAAPNLHLCSSWSLAVCGGWISAAQPAPGSRGN